MINELSQTNYQLEFLNKEIKEKDKECEKLSAQLKAMKEKELAAVDKEAEARGMQTNKADNHPQELLEENEKLKGELRDTQIKAETLHDSNRAMIIALSESGHETAEKLTKAFQETVKDGMQGAKCKTALSKTVIIFCTRQLSSF